MPLLVLHSAAAIGQSDQYVCPRDASCFPLSQEALSRLRDALIERFFSRLRDDVALQQAGSFEFVLEVPPSRDTLRLNKTHSSQLLQALLDIAGDGPARPELERRLSREGTTAEEAVQLEHQMQVATHASVRNVITSMRLLSAADWAVFFESVSLVHEALCAGTRVAEMDFPTRDRYRHAVEELSRGTDFDELEVARRAVRPA